MMFASCKYNATGVPCFSNMTIEITEIGVIYTHISLFKHMEHAGHVECECQLRQVQSYVFLESIYDSFFQCLQQNNAALSHYSTAKASVISVGLSVTEVRLDEIDGTQLV